MRPPYDPRHVERVLFPRNGGGGTDTTVAQARCSCGWDGRHHPIGIPGVAARLGADLNAHRLTYVAETA